MSGQDLLGGVEPVQADLSEVLHGRAPPGGPRGLGAPRRSPPRLPPHGPRCRPVRLRLRGTGHGRPLAGQIGQLAFKIGDPLPLAPVERDRLAGGPTTGPHRDAQEERGDRDDQPRQGRQTAYGDGPEQDTRQDAGDTGAVGGGDTATLARLPVGSSGAGQFAFGAQRSHVPDCGPVHRLDLRSPSKDLRVPTAAAGLIGGEGVARGQDPQLGGVAVIGVGHSHHLSTPDQERQEVHGENRHERHQHPDLDSHASTVCGPVLRRSHKHGVLTQRRPTSRTRLAPDATCLSTVTFAPGASRDRAARNLLRHDREGRSPNAIGPRSRGRTPLDRRDRHPITRSASAPSTSRPAPRRRPQRSTSQASSSRQRSTSPATTVHVVSGTIAIALARARPSSRVVPGGDVGSAV